MESGPLSIRASPLLRKNVSQCAASEQGKGPRSLARNASPRMLVLLLSQIPDIHRGAEPIATGPWGRDRSGHAILPGHLAPPALSPHLL